jgi:hypothetical protein
MTFQKLLIFYEKKVYTPKTVKGNGGNLRKDNG